MYYQEIIYFLKRRVQKPSFDHPWSSEDNSALLSYLRALMPESDIQKIQAAIKKAFSDFFEPLGTLDLSFHPETGIDYTVTPYTVKPQMSRHLDQLVKIIRAHSRHIEYPYHGRSDQIALKKEMTLKIDEEITATDEPVNKKELVRHAIRAALELQPDDVIVELDDKFIIKIFKVNPYLNLIAPDPLPKDDAERRYNGYNSDDLNNHFMELLSEINLERFLDNVMAILFETELDFRKIDHHTFEQIVLKAVKEKIADELAYYISPNHDYAEGFSGYIFRQHFEAIYERIAFEVYSLISEDDQNALRFFQHYVGEEVLEEMNIPEQMSKLGYKKSVAVPLPPIYPAWKEQLLEDPELLHLNRSFVEAMMQHKSA